MSLNSLPYSVVKVEGPYPRSGRLAGGGRCQTHLNDNTKWVYVSCTRQEEKWERKNAVTVLFIMHRDRFDRFTLSQLG